MQFLNRMAYNSSDDDHFDFESDESNKTVEEVDENEYIDDEAVPKGTCIMCLKNLCDIILLPCFHIVVCSTCWEKTKSTHEKQCDILYSKNKRKLTLEKKKVKCPTCDDVVKNTNEFHMANFN